MDLADRHDGGFQRIDVARDDRLDLIDDLRAHQHAVDRHMRPRRVAAEAFDVDVDAVGRRHHRAGPDGEVTDREAGIIVHPVHLLDPEPVHHAVVDHLAAAAAALFGRLEDHHRGAVEVARLGKIFRGAEQHGGVAVMAASVHLAGDLGGIGYARRLHDRQRIHVGAQANGLARGGLAAADHADDAGAADAGHDLVATERAQFVGDDAGGAVDFVEQLRVLVEVMAPGGHFVGEGGNTVDDGHGAGSVSYDEFGGWVSVA